MWESIAKQILAKRGVFLAIILGLTTFMWLHRGGELAHDFAPVVPENDPEYLRFSEFQATFGSEGNLIYIMVTPRSKDLFEPIFLEALYHYTEKLKAAAGVKGVISMTHLPVPSVFSNKQDQQIELLSESPPVNRQESDELAAKIKSLHFYRSKIFDAAYTSTIVIVELDARKFNSPAKYQMISEVRQAEDYIKQEADVSYGGLPIIREFLIRAAEKELGLFMAGAILLILCVLYAIFRSPILIVTPLLCIVLTLIWTLGIIGLLGYKTNLLTGTIPAIVAIIGTPNFIYLLTKYQMKYRDTGNKQESIKLVFGEVGYIIAITNLTTAFGFGVIGLSDIKIMNEFGLASCLSILSTFIVSIIILPIVFSLMPPPTAAQSRHLSNSWMQRQIVRISQLLTQRRKLIYSIALAGTLLSLVGIRFIEVNTSISDDISSEDRIKKDMLAIEEKMKGLLPYELVIKARREGGMKNLPMLKRVEAFQDSLDAKAGIGATISVVDLMKFANQSRFGGNPAKYRLPGIWEFMLFRGFLDSLSSRSLPWNSKLVDSTFQTVRITGTVKDVGLQHLTALNDTLQRDFTEIFDTSRYELGITGTTQLFLRGNEYLVKNLIQSILLALLAATIFIGLTFRSIRLTMVCLVVNLLPLLCLAGAMGWLGIAMKPSTCIIFTMSLGIAVDDSLHLLVCYQKAQQQQKLPVGAAVKLTLREAGRAMIYTTVVLFSGFAVFSLSDFGGIRAMGLLTSATLLLALLCDLFLLPALLLSTGRNET